MSPELLAKIDQRLRPLLVRLLPPKTATSLYSRGRKCFLQKLERDVPPPREVPKDLETVLWGITFRSPLFNAAGMFKNGEAYELCAAQGAGAYLAGTSTAAPRVGNERNGIELPFAPYPYSRSSSNWLGLPNAGDESVAARLSGVNRVDACPVGASLMGAPELDESERLERLVYGMELYRAAKVDFIEINESCPNTESGRPQDDGLRKRLEYIASRFLVERGSDPIPPVLVKFSNDTEPAQVGPLIEMLVGLGYDGINFGNTSTQYQQYVSKVDKRDRKLFDYFVNNFGGGLGGALLKSASLSLVAEASSCIEAQQPSREFHIVRTGGVESAIDVAASLAAGASLVQWYSGYFENFSVRGHSLYHSLYRELKPLLSVSKANDG